MDLLLSSTEPPKDPESWMKRYLKPIIAAICLFSALFLTIYRQGPEGGLSIATHKLIGATPGRTPQNYDLTALKVFNAALVRVKDNYVTPKMIKPKQMLIAALDEVEKTVAEVLVEENKSKNKVKVKVDSFEKKFDITGVDSPWALSSRMKSILRFIQSHLLKGTKVQDVEYAAINGMLSTLDPHSILLPPETYNEMKLSTRGEFGGLGIVISMVQGVLTVMNPMKDTPAFGAGIKACDQILKIGEESTVNMTLTQAVNRLRGVPGSTVDITLMRKGWSRPVRKTLKRAIIKVPAVKSRMLGKKIGYISLSSFQGNSLDDLRSQLKKLKRKQMRGLILDLRGNPGGLLDQAIKISDLFIESGTLVTTVSFAGKKREEKRASAAGTEGRYPMVVLVDSGSASASEIVAGALKNLDRSIVIGKRTFGKGTVQVLYDNEDGSALKLTIAEYLTPGDISIQAVGITPDVVTSPVRISKDLIRLRQSDDHARREQDLDKHLATGRNAAKDAKPTRRLFYLAEPDKQNATKDKKDRNQKPKNLCLYPDRECTPSEEDKFVEDFQIRVAQDLLSRASSWRRSQILKTAGSFFDKQVAEQEKKIIDAVSKVDVDWKKISIHRGGKPEIKVSVTTDPRQGKAMACRTMKLTLKVKNEGNAPTSRLRATSKSTNRIFNGHEFIFGKVAPNESKSWTVPVSIRDAPTRIDDVTFHFKEANGNEPQPFAYPISIQGVKRPVFSYAYQLIDDIDGNHDGQAQRGEKVRLFVKVRNSGKGTSFRTITTLKNLSGVGIFIRKGRFVLGKLAPGQSTSEAFTLEVQNVYAQSSFKVELTVYDDALREFVSKKIKIPIIDAHGPPQAAKGVVRVSADRAPVRAWSEDNAPVIGHAPRGAGFKVLGRYTGWYRVLVGSSRPAFIASKDVTPGGSPSPSKFTPLWQVTPPKLLIRVPSYATSNKTIQIEGTASDQEQIKDLFIFVRNPEAKISARKIYYQSNGSNGDRKSLSFSTTVPLWPGANYVSIHARENEDVQADETVVIFRKKEIAVAGSNNQPSADKKPTPVIR